MTELVDGPQPDKPADPVPDPGPDRGPDPGPEAVPPHEAVRPAGRGVLPWLCVAGFLILAVALFWVWRHPAGPASVAAAADTRQLADLEARVSRLEHQPTPQPPDLAPLEARIAALERRPVAAPVQAPKPPDLAPLEARIGALAAELANSQLPGRVDALSARVDEAANAQRGLQSDMTRRLDADEARLAAIERNTAQIQALASRADRLGQIQTAQLALNAGQKLGSLPGAPAALARFAATAPPTEAGLRQAFEPAARAAEAAARPSSDGKPLLARAWAEAQDLVTIRQGDHVLVGDPIAGVLERARAALDAGDLAGAVAAVATLTGPPAPAMAGWLADARALLDARAALADWAAHA